MALELPLDSRAKVEASLSKSDPALLRLAGDFQEAIDQGLSLDAVQTQGFEDWLPRAIREALVIVHEFLCTESARFAEARKIFFTGVEIGINACAEIIAAKFGGLEIAKEIISAAFRIVINISTQKYCDYMSKNQET